MTAPLRAADAPTTYAGFTLADGSPITEIGCSLVMFRGAMTGRVIACGVCDWCRSITPIPSDEGADR